MRATITDAKAIAAIWKATGQTGDVPTQLTISTAKGTETRECACGCGQQTARVWFPGHDAKYKSELYAQVRGDDDEARIAATDELLERGWPLPAPKKTKKTEVPADVAA